MKKAKTKKIFLILFVIALCMFGYLRTPKVLNAVVMSYLEELSTKNGDNSSTTQTDPETTREVDVYVDDAYTVRRILPLLSKPAATRLVRSVPELSPPIIRIGEKMVGNHQKLYYTSPIGVIEYSLAEKESLALLLCLGSEMGETYPEAREAFSEGVIWELQREPGGLVTIVLTGFSDDWSGCDLRDYESLMIETPKKLSAYVADYLAANFAPPEPVQPPDGQKFLSVPFSSVDQMLEAFAACRTPGTAASAEYSAEELAALQTVAEQNISDDMLLIPVWYDTTRPDWYETELPLRNKPGLDNILVESGSAYGLPLIWYYAELDGADVIITSGVLPEEQIAQIGDGGIAALKEVHAELLSALPPDPNAEQTTVTTRYADAPIGGKILPAAITQYSTDPRCHVEFILDGTLYVKVCVYPEDYDRGLLKRLTFAALPCEL